MTNTAPSFTAWSSERHQLGEGLRRLEDGSMVMVDILAKSLIGFDPHQPDRETVLHRLDVHLGAVAPVAGDPTAWVVAAGTGIAVLTPNGLEWIDRPEDGAATAMRMNDAVCDPHGRFWAGSMAYDSTPRAGSLYRMDPDGSVVQVLDGFTVPNGPAFSRDGSVMYLADTPLGIIDAFDIGPNGDLGARRRFADVSDGSPDGMVVDDDGHVWSAIWGGGRIERRAPSGELVDRMDVPATQPTSIGFGAGPGAGLFVTTAAVGLDRPEREDGRLLRAPAPVLGPATPAVTLR